MEVRQVFKPKSIEGVLAILQQYPDECLIISGGTDLIPDLRKGNKQTRGLISLKEVEELHHITITEREVCIGAGVTFYELSRHGWLQSNVPALAEAASSVGAVPLQTMATWAGNLVQAMPAADGAIVALALESQVRVESAGGAVWKNVEELFLAPGESAIDAGREFISQIRFPIPQGQWGTGWQRLGRRPALTLPILNCAVKLEIANEMVVKAIIALGPVAPTPFRCRNAEEYLQGKSANEENFQKAAILAQGESKPRGNILRATAEYRKEVIPVLVTRALRIAYERAKQSNSTTHV